MSHVQCRVCGLVCVTGSVEHPWKRWYVPGGPPVLVCSDACGETLPKMPKTKRPARKLAENERAHTPLMDRAESRAAILLDHFDRLLDLAATADDPTCEIVLGVLGKRVADLAKAEFQMVSAFVGLIEERMKP